jgi:hypothetical protein
MLFFCSWLAFAVLLLASPFTRGTEPSLPLPGEDGQEPDLPPPVDTDNQAGEGEEAEDGKNEEGEGAGAGDGEEAEDGKNEEGDGAGEDAGEGDGEADQENDDPDEVGENSEPGTPTVPQNCSLIPSSRSSLFGESTLRHAYMNNGISIACSNECVIVLAVESLRMMHSSGK